MSEADRPRSVCSSHAVAAKPSSKLILANFTSCKVEHGLGRVGFQPLTDSLRSVNDFSSVLNLCSVEVHMPVPGSQVVGFRPLLDHEERLYCEKPELEPVEKKWSPIASVLFIVATSSVLWIAIGLSMRAVF
jgi:hypothetical protein